LEDFVGGCCSGHQPGLIPVREVRDELLALCGPVSEGHFGALEDTVGRTAFCDIFAPLPLPPFDNSAMDGYAVGSSGARDSFQVQARTAAGEAAFEGALGPDQAVRIFTGAPVPQGTAGVVMQEDVTLEGDRIVISAPVREKQHIRHAGEDVAVGDLLIKAGTRIDPRHVAILAASGLTGVPTVKPVRIAMFSSGRELREPGSALGPASIHDSNRWMLKSVLRGRAVEVVDLGILPDDRVVIARALAEAAKDADLVLGTGGVSVGEEDHIWPALEQIGAAPMRRKMALKPGKPVVFGKIDDVIILCLPGNPVAALVSFLHLARPLITTLSGGAVPDVRQAPASAGFEWARAAGRTEFFPARQTGFDKAGLPVLEKLGRGGSAMLQPLIEADGLACVDGDVSFVAPGDRLGWLPFNAGFAL